MTRQKNFVLAQIQINLNLHVVRNDETDFQNPSRGTGTADVAWVPVCLGNKGMLTPAINFQVFDIYYYAFGWRNHQMRSFTTSNTSRRLASNNWHQTALQHHNKRAPCEMPKQTRNSGKGDNLCSTLNDDIHTAHRSHTQIHFWKPETTLLCVFLQYIWPFNRKKSLNYPLITLGEGSLRFTRQARDLLIGKLVSAKFAHCTSCCTRARWPNRNPNSPPLRSAT